MAEEVGTLELNLRAKIGDLERDLKKAEGRANTSGKRIARNMQGAFKGIGSIRVKLGLLAFGLAQIAALGGMKRLIDGSLAAADAIGKTSDKLGISNSALQEFQFAAVQSGVKIETLNMGLQRFGRRAAEAAGGTGEARGALKQLGIQLTDTNGSLRSTEDLFVDSMKALAGIENPLERVRLGFKLFDSEGVALVNMAGNLGELREEAQRMGIVLEDEVISKASETKDTLSALAQVTSNQLTPALVSLGGTALTNVAIGLSKVAQWANRVYIHFADIRDLGLISSMVKRDEIIAQVIVAEKAVSDLAAANKKLEEEGFARGNSNSSGKRRQAEAEREAARLNALMDEAIEQVAVLEGKRLDAARGSGAPSINAKAEENGRKQRQKIAARAIEDLRKSQTDEIGNLAHAAGEKLKVFQDLSAEQIENEKDTSEAIRAIVIQLGSDISAVHAETALKEKEENEKAVERELKLKQRQADNLKKIRSGILQDFQEATMSETVLLGIELDKQLAAHKKLLEDEGISQEKYNEDILLMEQTTQAKIAALQDDGTSAMESALDRRNKAFEESYGFIRDGFSDAMADMLIDGKFNFKALYQSFLREFVNRAVARLAGSAFTSLGNIFSPTPIGPLQADGTFNGIGENANGGPISGPTLVGERGPELFLPHTSGFIANNQSLNKMGGGGGGGVSVTVINNTGKETSTTERDGPGGSREIEVMVGKAISKNIARGGDVDQAIRNSYGVNRVGRHGV
jgi:hypothetical protein